MADQHHIQWLFEGREEWNTRRRENDFTPDFPMRTSTRPSETQTSSTMMETSRLLDSICDARTSPVPD